MPTPQEETEMLRFREDTEKSLLRASERAQQAKVLATKPHNLSSLLGSPVVEAEC